MYIFCKQHHDVCELSPKSAAQIVCRVSLEQKWLDDVNSKIKIKIKVKSTPYMQICKVIDASLSKNTVGET